MEGVPGGVAVVPPEQQFAERYIRFSKRFRELLQQRINRAEIIEQIYYPLYDKHFTVEELKGLVAFYKTPVGQKAIQVMPQLVQEAMQKASELMLPKLRALVGEIMEEEMNRLKK
jgi:hypothetical protein